MAYDKKKIFEQAKDLIEKKRLIFVEDVVALLPISRQTFYEFFPLESDKSDTLKELIDKNKIELKSSMRSKWYKSEKPPLQLALYKLMATPEELKKLSMQHHDLTTNGENISFGSFLKKSNVIKGE